MQINGSALFKFDAIQKWIASDVKSLTHRKCYALHLIDGLFLYGMQYYFYLMVMMRECFQRNITLRYDIKAKQKWIKWSERER